MPAPKTARAFLLKRENPQVLQQNLEAHENQDDAPRQLRPGLVAKAEDVAHLQPRSGEEESGDADEGHGGEDMYIRQQGEGDAHRQGVDAGGHGQEEHGAEAEGIVMTFLVPGKALPDHVSANEGQEDECDPVVKGADILVEGGAQQEADGGHQRLEAAEPGAGEEVVPGLQPLDGQALADGDGEGVRRKAGGDQQQFQNIHGGASLFM